MTTVSPTVRFARRSSRGVLLGFTTPQLICAGLALAVALFALAVMGGGWLASLSPIWLGLLLLTFWPARGRPAVESLPVAADYALRKVAGQTTFKVRPDRPRPAGTMALPGDGAALRFHEDPDTGAVMVHDHHGRTLTVVARVSHPAHALLTPDEQSAHHGAFGTLLAALATTGNCARIQILEQARPSTGRGVHEWFTEQGSVDAPAWARKEYAQVLATRSRAGATHETFIGVSLDMKSAAGAIKAAGRGVAGAAKVLRADMTALESGLSSSGLTLAGWVDAVAMAGIIRNAYDQPGGVATDGTGLGRDLATAGPVFVREHLGYLEHDGGVSASLWISEWPRQDSQYSFLAPIVFAPGVSHTTSITITPLDLGKAMGTLRTEKTEQAANALVDAKHGITTSEAAWQERADTIDRERALMVGHADTRFTGIITATATTKEGLDAAVNQLQRAAISAGCETRLLWGQQAQAFLAGALPLVRRVH